MAREIIYAATDSTHGTELWITDGTAAGTGLLTDLTAPSMPVAQTSNPRELTALGNGLLLFTATSDGTEPHRQLWVTDGTAAGTHLVRTENYDGFTPMFLASLGNGRAVFNANRGLGQELWVTDGTEAGTFQLKDIYPGVSGSTQNSSFPENFTPIGNGRLLFDASDATHGDELWVTDGTVAGTNLVKDIHPGTGSGGFGYATPYGTGHVIFQADDGSGTDGPWITDGTTAGTTLVATIGNNPNQFLDLGNGKVVFKGNIPGNKTGLYVTDGTTAGTVLINSNAANLTSLALLGNGRAVFAAGDNSNSIFAGDGIWVTDGTAAGTSVISYIPPAGGGLGTFVNASFFSLGNGRVVFDGVDGARTGNTGTELYVTDGTTISLVKDINTQPSGLAYSGSSSNPGFLSSLGGGRALFTAYDGTNQGLWVTDGTAAGTSLLNAATVSFNTPGSVVVKPVEITGTLPGKAVVGDFNGDGKSDLLLQNDNGAIVIETTNGLAVTGGGLINSPGPTWHVVGTADFNGDGQNDILLQNDNGAIVDYLMNATTITAGNLLTNPGPTWHVRGTGDFNADGKADIILQNDNGLIFVEYTNGITVTGGAAISNPGPSWTVEGVADFNGDGQPDLLLQNTNGTLVDFLMNGATVAAGYQLLGPNVGFSVAGTGNYNGDNRADILVHNDDGTNILLYANGQSVIGSAAPIGNPGANWTTAIAGVDYNGDGSSDLLIENTAGTIFGYTLDATGTVIAANSITNPGAGWRALGGPPIQFIDGTGAATSLTGTAGVDEFNLTSFTAGIHTISNFDAAADLIALSAAAIGSYANIQAHESAYNGGTAIGLSANAALVIQGVATSQLSSANFVLR